ncbi:hypothetical protein K438DRAFT_2151354 [Mycena galopus ATCC 62051]|nr:hypothetical protein K438DRAFT_2151354 [Mycena galopus ATCC 62051]
MILLETHSLPSMPTSSGTLVPYAYNPWPFRWIFLYYLKLRHTRLYCLCQRTGSDFTSFFYTLIFFGPLASIALLDSIMHRCVPPYYPCPGHKSISMHDSQSGCVFYAVWAGRCQGVYSNLWIANDQTYGYTDSVQRGFKKWRELEHGWGAKCIAEHKGHCPPFESVTFSLNPPYLSSSPCSCISTAIVDTAPSSAKPSSPAATLRVALSALMLAPSLFGASLSSSTSSSNLSSASSSTSTLFDDDDPKEEPITPKLMLNVPPHVTPAPAYVAGAPALAAPAPTVAATPQAVRQGLPAHSILVTPQPAAAANPPAPTAVPAAISPELYGICSVAVFYFSHELAIAGAASLGLTSSKILVSHNAAKVKAWMQGLSFTGDENRNKKNDDDGDNAPKTSGQPSDFTGQCLAFLMEKIPDCIASKAAWDKRGQDGGEPDPTASPPVIATAEDVFTALGLNLTDEEQDRKTKIPKDTKAAQFMEKHGSEPKAKHIALRCEVAKEMWAAESEEV